MNPGCTELQSIVSIFSAAHSGSTLLALMAGAHSKAFYVGEFHALVRWINENKKCGCGRSVKECDFWGAVNNRYQDLYGLNFFSCPKKLLTYETYNVRKHPNYIWKFQKATAYLGTAYDLLVPLRWLTRFRWQKLVRTTVDLFNLVSKVSGSTIIVDSTKSQLRTYNQPFQGSTFISFSAQEF